MSGDGPLTHLDANGRTRMVDVSGKSHTKQDALAEGWVRMAPETVALATSGGGRKGDVRAVGAATESYVPSDAQIAGDQ